MSTPCSSVGRVGLEQYLGRVAMLGAVLVVLTNPVLVGAILFWFVVVLALAWLLGRVGMLGGVGLLVALARGGRGRPQAWQPPTLSFRCQFATVVSEVRVRGFDSGVQLGDQVAVSGLVLSGTIESTSVRNLTTGAGLRRHGLTRLVVLGLVCGWLLLTVVSQVAAQ